MSEQSEVEQGSGVTPAGSGYSAEPEPSFTVSAVPVNIPNASGEWHLVCITRKGRVSMLRNLDLRTARQTYQRLLPGTRPEKWIDPGCERCRSRSERAHAYGCYISSRETSGDYLERVEALGPEGCELDPWHGVEPVVRYYYHCDCPPPPPPWDETRSDFWNNPNLWQGIDPTKQLCWSAR